MLSKYTLRPALLGPAALLLAAAPALLGCSRDFWYRESKVAGVFERPAFVAPLGGLALEGGVELTGSPDGAPGAVAYRPPAPVAQPLPVPTLTGSPDGPPAGRVQVPVSAQPSLDEMGVLAEVNRERARQGLGAIRFDDRLYAAARAHSIEQLRDNYLGHDSRDPNRIRLSQRTLAEGYVGRLYAEVVARDFTNVRGVVQAWLESPSHRAVLLDPELSEGAFARVDSADGRTNRWTGDFGAPVEPYTPVSRAPLSAPAAPSGAARPVSIPATPAPRSAPAVAAPTTPAPALVRPPPPPPPPSIAPAPLSQPRAVVTTPVPAPAPVQAPRPAVAAPPVARAPVVPAAVPPPAVNRPPAYQPRAVPPRQPVIIRRQPSKAQPDCPT